MHGQGINFLSNGRRYVGHFENDKKEGPGTLYFPDGSIFEGNFKEGERHGEGSLTKPEGTKVAEIWENGIKKA